MSPKVNHIGFGAQGHVRKSRNHSNEGFEGSHITKSKSYKFKLEQNNPTELLSISFPETYYPKLQQNRKKKQSGFSNFYGESVSGTIGNHNVPLFSSKCSDPDGLGMLLLPHLANRLPYQKDKQK